MLDKFNAQPEQETALFLLLWKSLLLEKEMLSTRTQSSSTLTFGQTRTLGEDNFLLLTETPSLFLKDKILFTIFHHPRPRSSMQLLSMEVASTSSQAQTMLLLQSLLHTISSLTRMERCKQELRNIATILSWKSPCGERELTQNYQSMELR